jgi:hypothetical protein
MAHTLEAYFMHRGEMMLRIEQEDIEQQKLVSPPQEKQIR